MRITVYVQSFSCIALLCFPGAKDLLRSSFRTSVLTMYAIGFAFFMAHHTGSYSLQSILVAHCFVDILMLSAFSLLCFSPCLRDWKRYVLLAGGCPFAVWTFVQAGTRKTDCFDSLQFKTVSVDAHTLTLYKSFWAASGVVYLLSLPCLILIWVQTRSQRRWHLSGASWLAAISWFLASVSTVAASEVIMATLYYAQSNNQLVTLQTTDWSFGQTFAVVMLFFVIWDIISYPFEESESAETPMTKLRHWWHGIKLRYPKLFGGISTTHNANNSGSSSAPTNGTGKNDGTDYVKVTEKDTTEPESTEITDVEKQSPGNE
jgi:hypothetical protein